MSRADYLAKRSDQKRQSVLSAARARFAADGFSGASVEQIAQAAEVSTATLYKLFPSKAELFGAVWRAEIDAFVSALAAHADMAIEERPAAMALAYAHLLEDPVRLGLMRALLSGAAATPELGATFFDDVRNSIGAAFGDLGEALYRKKLTRARDLQEARTATSQLMGMIEHFLLWGLIFSNAKPKGAPDEIAAWATTTFWRAWGAEKPRR